MEEVRVRSTENGGSMTSAVTKLRPRLNARDWSTWDTAILMSANSTKAPPWVLSLSTSGLQGEERWPKIVRAEPVLLSRTNLSLLSSEKETTCVQRWQTHCARVDAYPTQLSQQPCLVLHPRFETLWSLLYDFTAFWRILHIHKTPTNNHKWIQKTNSSVSERRSPHSDTWRTWIPIYGNWRVHTAAYNSRDSYSSAGKNAEIWQRFCLLRIGSILSKSFDRVLHEVNFPIE